MEESHIMKLSTDFIIFEVFIRLSAKAIMCAMCACTSWYKLLSNPEFTDYYTKNTRFTATLWLHRSQNYRNHIRYRPHLPGNIFQVLEMAENGAYFRTSINPKSPEFYLTGPEVSIVGSCNGLLFIRLLKGKGNYPVIWSENVYICNPLFDGFVKLPRYKRRLKRLVRADYRPGYIPSTDTYKLLRLVFDGNNVKKAAILTLGQDRKWRKVDDPRLACFIRTTKRGVSFMGSYYWIDKRGLQICYFDFREEKCCRMSKPPGSGMELRVLKGRLCLIDRSDLNRLVIWTMNEYPNKKTWSKNDQVNCRFDLLPVTIDENRPLVQLSNVDRNGLVSFHRGNKTSIGLGMWTNHTWLDRQPLVSFTPRFCPFRDDKTRLQPSKRSFWSKIFSPCLFH